MVKCEDWIVNQHWCSRTPCGAQSGNCILTLLVPTGITCLPFSEQITTREGQGRKQSSSDLWCSLEVASIHSEGPGLKIWLIHTVNLALHLAVAVDMLPLWSSCSVHDSQCTGKGHQISWGRTLLVPFMGYCFLLLCLVLALFGFDGSLPLDNEQGHALEEP